MHYTNTKTPLRMLGPRPEEHRRHNGKWGRSVSKYLCCWHKRIPKDCACIATVGHGQVKSWTVLTDDLYCDLARVDGIQPSAQSDAYNDTSQCPEHQHFLTEGEVLELAPAAFGRWGFAHCHLLFGAHVCCRLDVHDEDMTRSSKGHSQARQLLAPSLCEPENITWVRLRGCT